MTRTAVQLRESRPSGQLVYGAPALVTAGPRGPAALFVPGALVVYRVESAQRRSRFVFQTLRADDRLAAAVPGVRPHVQLLLQLHTVGAARRVLRLLADLLAGGWAVDELPDVFWHRVAAAVGGRLPPHATLVSLLRRERVGPLR